MRWLLAGGGEFAGVGLELRTEGQHIVLNHILSDTPAAAQKDLYVGDRIVAVAQDKEPAVQVQNIAQNRIVRPWEQGTIRWMSALAGRTG